MATLQITNETINDTNVNEESFVDMATIRRRLATIKNQWTPETVRARAIEGARRRAELEALLGFECTGEGIGDDHGFSLVG